MLHALRALLGAKPPQPLNPSDVPTLTLTQRVLVEAGGLCSDL